MPPENITLRFQDTSVHLTIHCKPFSLSLSNADTQQEIWRLKSIQLRSKDSGWNKISSADVKEHSAESCKLSLLEKDYESGVLEISLQRSAFSIRFDAAEATGEWVSFDFDAREDENFSGFGERFDSINQRGKQVTLWVEDGAHAGFTYFPSPFFQSSRGYGVWIDTQVKCLARMATPDDPRYVSIRNSAPQLHLVVFFGNSPKEILSQYTQIAGRPPLPPKWVFGPWKSRDWQTANQEGIIEDIQQQFALGLPSAVKLIDARWENAYHTFRFDPAKFPDPKAMIDEIHANGNKLVVWITPWMAVNNENDPDDDYYDAAEKGYLLKDENGEVYVHQLGLNPMLVGACIDFTNPQAIAWWKEKMAYLIDLGVDGFNTDFGEQIPENVVFFNGKTGREMHNIYPLLYNEITWQVMQEKGIPPVLLSRSGWHGSQAHSVIWAGDQSSDFSLNSGMHTALMAGQTAGLSGFPFWTCDIGGYFGNPTDEVYMRWTQMGAFCPIMMIHGAGVREPWYFSAQALENYRKYARLHTELLPYIYSYAHIAVQSGIPIMRAMALEFPKDPSIWSELCEDQYCFGGELLVAPVHYGFSRTRPVYLPGGLWRDFWNGRAAQGGQEVPCRAEIDHIPVFARAGAIIPMLDPTPLALVEVANDQIQSAGNDLKVKLYPGKDGSFRLYDGTLFEWHEEEQKLLVFNSPMKRFVSVQLMDGENGRKFAVSQNGKAVEASPANLEGDGRFTRALVDGNEVVFCVS